MHRPSAWLAPPASTGRWLRLRRLPALLAPRARPGATKTCQRRLNASPVMQASGAQMRPATRTRARHACNALPAPSSPSPARQRVANVPLARCAIRPCQHRPSKRLPAVLVARGSTRTRLVRWPALNAPRASTAMINPPHLPSPRHAPRARQVASRTSRRAGHALNVVRVSCAMTQ